MQLHNAMALLLLVLWVWGELASLNFFFSIWKMG